MTSAKTFTVGICGGSGSGKTHLLKALKERLPDGEVSSLSQDDYYLPKEQLFKDEQGILNFDHPTCLDQSRMIEDLASLKNGRSIELKEYTFNNPSLAPKILKVHPSPLIIIEGLFCFYIHQVFEQLDLKVYVEVDVQTMLDRRIQRDAAERNYDRDDVIYRFQNHVMPAYHKFTLPFRDAADIVINNESEDKFNQGLEELIKAFGNNRR